MMALGHGDGVINSARGAGVRCQRSIKPRPCLENRVHNELERRGAEVGYVKTGDGFEVDFLARRPEGGEELIRVCADLSAPETRVRELRALAAAGASSRAALNFSAKTG